MSTSRTKQIAQKRKGKTKRSGNGAKLSHAKRTNMKKSSIKHFTGGKKR